MLGMLTDPVLLNNNQTIKSGSTSYPEMLTTQQTGGGDANSNADGFANGSSQAATLSYTTDDHNDGAGSIKLLSDYAGSNNLSLYLEYATGNQYFPVTVGQTYTFKGYVKSDVGGSSDCKARIRWYTSANSFLSNSDGTITNSPTSWTEKTVTATAPATAAKAKLTIMTTKTQNHYTLHDTFSFKRTA